MSDSSKRKRPLVADKRTAGKGGKPPRKPVAKKAPAKKTAAKKAPAKKPAAKKAPAKSAAAPEE